MSDFGTHDVNLFRLFSLLVLDLGVPSFIFVWHAVVLIKMNLRMMITQGLYKCSIMVAQKCSSGAGVHRRMSVTVTGITKKVLSR